MCFRAEHCANRSTGLARAKMVVLTRADMVDQSERSRIRAIVQQHAPQIGWAECRHAPSRLLAADGREESLQSLQGKRLAAFCGLGNPTGFRHTLEQCGYQVAAWREFPDHFVYNRNTVEELSRWIESQRAEAAVCTHKDLVKLAVNELAGQPLRAVLVGLDFLSGQNELETRLNQLEIPGTAAK